MPIVEATPGSTGLGGGLRFTSNPYIGDTDTGDLVPLYLYEGRWLFAHGTAFGVHAYRNTHFTLDLFARYRFMQLDPDGDDQLEGIEKRKQSLDAGLSLAYQQRWGQVKLDWVRDTADRHSGHEADFTYRYQWRRGPWSFSPFISVARQSANLTRYYYGVSESEALPLRPAYAPEEAWNVSYGLNTSYQFGNSVFAFANVGLTQFDDVIQDSPLVDQATAAALYAGAGYMFGNALGPAKGASPEREREWSWRLNYGYQADGNIVSDIDQGDFSKSSYADTNLAGFTMSRLLNDGPRVDFYGRAVLYRHLEEPLQDDFFSAAAYIMAMGKGYLAWSDIPFFRWGFGFGASYAQKVPIVEQLKQERRGRETAQFLNYLEMQLDFSLNAMTKGRGGILNHCYTGLSVAHRSGIFSTSDLLGNVAGGSDWITLHLECLY